MSHWSPQPTQDGSFTFFSEAFGESFHSHQGARSEAFSKYAHVTQLPQKAESTPHLRILDVCYGLGYNTAAALETIWQVNPSCHITLVGLELDASVPIGAIALDLWAEGAPQVRSILTQLAHTHQVVHPTLHATLLIGDARQTIQPLQAQGFLADAIFFDPFSPQHCPQLWTVEFFQAVAGCLSPNGILSTYSRAAAVRAAMQKVGLTIGSLPVVGLDPLRSHEWSQGTLACWGDVALPPLSQLEHEHLQTRAAVPYRDPTLKDSATVIRERHTQEQHTSSLESTTRWRKRWGIR